MRFAQIACGNAFSRLDYLRTPQTGAPAIIPPRTLPVEAKASNKQTPQTGHYGLYIIARDESSEPWLNGDGTIRIARAWAVFAANLRLYSFSDGYRQASIVTLLRQSARRQAEKIQGRQQERNPDNRSSCDTRHDTQ